MAELSRQKAGLLGPHVAGWFRAECKWIKRSCGAVVQDRNSPADSQTEHLFSSGAKGASSSPSGHAGSLRVQVLHMATQSTLQSSCEVGRSTCKIGPGRAGPNIPALVPLDESS